MMDYQYRTIEQQVELKKKLYECDHTVHLQMNCTTVVQRIVQTVSSL